MYEITFITKEEAKGKEIQALIESLGGKISHSSSLGQKQFVYPIKKEVKGYYTTFTFELEPDKIFELNRKLVLQEEVLRFLIITAKGAITEPKTAAKIKIEMPKIKEETEFKTEEIIETPEIKEKPAAEPLVKVKKVKVEKVQSVEKPRKIVEEILSEKEAEEDRLKALDKKLDELLKE